MGQNDIIFTIDPDVLLKRTHAIASYYGFEYLPNFLHGRRDRKTKATYPQDVDPKLMDPISGTFAQFLRQMKEYDVDPAGRARFLWHSNITPGRKTPKQLSIHLHILGVEKSIADALMLRTFKALVRDLTKEDPVVHINSMGDADTLVRYSRELGNFFKRNITDLSPQCQTHLRNDPLEALDHLLRYEDALGHRAPSPLDYLSESSRVHLEELLEYLEATKTSYELSPHLFDRKGNLSETNFELTTSEGPIVRGGRYNTLATKFYEEGGHVVGGVLRANAKSENECKKVPKRKMSVPIVFVQVGPEAKRLSLSLLEDLRDANIKMTQTVGIESLMDQMEIADSIDTPYLMIMGHKEALDNSVIIRDRKTNSQTVVPIVSLVGELQKLT